MKYLILTEPDDTHAILVKLALEKTGHQVSLFFTADLPTKQRNSVFIDNHHYQWNRYDKYTSTTNNDYDVVWWRRVRKPYIPKHITHPDDYQFVTRENILFQESLTNNLAPQAWWINPKEAANRANSKLLQLQIAQQCGLRIPITLCSNDPHDIRTFLLEHEDSGVIYKPLCSNFWFDCDQIKVAYTTKVFFLNLPPNSILQQTPGIFQLEVKKKFELRVICFGDYIVAAKLNSQSHVKGEIDWRAIPEGEMSVEPYLLPPEVAAKIRQFMDKMGLVFGSLDLIVTPEDDYIFLEVNEQGQFLWLEEYNPSFKLLDMFVNFLQCGSKHFNWLPENLTHTIDSYRSDVESMLAENLLHHVNLNQINFNA